MEALEQKPTRVLAMIYPIERHIGHWACPSPSIDLRRIIMEGDAQAERLDEAIATHEPHAVAIIGKKVAEYHDLLDAATKRFPQLEQAPRIYRCQNTVFAHRVGQDSNRADKEYLKTLDEWFARACDERFSLVLVQTIDDVELIQKALHPTRAVACPYGYDVAVFDPDYPELERVTDVGCYFNLRDDPRRVKLVETAAEICKRNGWSFRFVSGKYWHEYADQIRTTKICLHQSDRQEIPYRMYETTCLGSLFLADPLKYSVDRFFTQGEEYLNFQSDLSDLEHVMHHILRNPARWETIRQAGKSRARNYTWPIVAEEYVAPTLKEIVDMDLWS